MKAALESSRIDYWVGRHDLREEGMTRVRGEAMMKMGLSTLRFTHFCVRGKDPNPTVGK
jgi:hypothetical protein